MLIYAVVQRFTTSDSDGWCYTTNENILNYYRMYDDAKTELEHLVISNYDAFIRRNPNWDNKEYLNNLYQGLDWFMDGTNRERDSELMEIYFIKIINVF